MKRKNETQKLSENLKEKGLYLDQLTTNMKLEENILKVNSVDVTTTFLRLSPLLFLLLVRSTCWDTLLSQVYKSLCLF